MLITILCGVTIVLFLIGYYMFCNSNIRAAKDELNELNEMLEKQDSASFEYSYDNLDYKFKQNSVIGSAWGEYSKSVVKIVDANIQQKLFSTVEASAFLNVNNVLSNLNISYWQNLAGVFTGLGILGTFLGLIVGLDNIDLQSTDINVLKTGISDLLAGLKNAFWTSLMGIGAAIGFNMWHGNTMQNLKLEINRFANNIDNFIVREPAEKWLAKNFTQNAEQTKQLKKFNTDLATSIGDTIDSKLENGVLADNLLKINEKLGVLNLFMEKKLVQAMGEAVGTQLDLKILPVLNEINSGIANISSGGANVIADKFNETAGESIASLGNTITEMNNNMKEVLTKLVATSESVHGELGSTIKNTIKELNKSVDAMVGQIEEQKKLMGESGEEANKKLQELFSDMDGKLTAIMENYGEQAEAINAKDIKARKEMSAGLQEFVDKAIGAIERHEKVIAAIEAELQKLNDGINVTIGKAQTAANTFERAAGPISEATESLKVQSVAMINACTNYNDNVKAGIDKLKETATENLANINKLRDGYEATQKAWGAYSEHFENVNGELGKIVNTMNNSLVQNQQAMRQSYIDSLNEYDTKLQEAVGLLAMQIKGLHQIALSLKKHQ